MLYLIELATFLITFLVTQVVDAQICADKWFGERCMYKCKCAANAQCDNNGNCPDNQCTSGFFGPGCQFYDRASDYTGTSLFLVDKNDATCNPIANATSVQLTLYTGFLFMWFRIVVNNEKNMLNFDVLINNRIPCYNMQKFPGNKMVDVTCENKIFMVTLTIEGAIAPDVCSVRLSAGRNMALRQDTSQSSDWIDSFSSASSNAVDYSKASTINSGSCATTGVSPSPWWRIKYNRPQYLLMLYITNRDTSRERLLGFRLQADDANGNMVFSYFANQTLAVYQVKGGISNPVTKIEIVRSQNPTPSEHPITICEFESFGETVCPAGTYGLWCEQKCQCKGVEICNPVNGLCARGCPTGFYGFGCESRCKPSCLNGLCTNALGTCVVCPPGKEGDHCENDCLNGFFGDNCESKCSVHCKGVCDHVTGHCSCKDNFGGATCTECAEGRFEDDCTEKCSTTCSGQKCNITTGECFSCLEEYTGRFCTGQSEKSQQTGLSNMWIVLVLLSGLTVAICGTFLFCGKRTDAVNPEQ